jgi:Phosphotransferase enzyme family
MAEQVEAVGLAREVTLAPGSGSADAVVCLAGARLSLRDAAGHLNKTSGVLYYETSGGPFPGRASPAHLLRTLTGLGLTSAGLYWVHPSFTGPRTYFPLEVKNALRWYLGNLHSTPARLPAIGLALHRLARFDPMLVGRLAPRLAVVASAGIPAEPRPLPLAQPDPPRPLETADLRPLLLIHGSDLSRAVMMPFSRTSLEPLAVLKITRGPPEAGIAPREPEVLEKVRASVDAPTRVSIPKPLAVWHSHGSVTTAESFLPGKWLRARLTRRGLKLGEAIDDLDLATAWIAQLHARFPLGARLWSAEEEQTYVDLPMKTYGREFGTTEAESLLFAQLEGLSRELLGMPLPIVWQHGDFSNLNTLRSGERLHVVDWEQAAPGIPLDDVVHFTRLWLYLVRRATREESFVAFRDLFLRHDHCDNAVTAARSAVSRYMRFVGIDPRFLPLLLAAGCLRRAKDRLAGQAILAQRGVDPRDGNRYVTYVELLSEHREALLELSQVMGRFQND